MIDHSQIVGFVDSQVVDVQFGNTKNILVGWDLQIFAW